MDQASRLRSGIFPSAFLILILICVFSPVSTAQEIPVSWPEVHALLSKPQILSNNDQKQILRYLDTDSLSELTKKELIVVSQKFERKITKDVQHITKLVGKLGVFLKNPYASGLGSMKKNDLVDCERELDRLAAKRKVIKAQYYFIQSDMSERELAKGIKANAGLLIKEGSPSVKAAWKTVEQKIAPSYGAWNLRYQQLNKRIKKYDRPAYGSKNYYSYDELRFLRNFRVIQSVLRRISEVASPDF